MSDQRNANDKSPDKSSDSKAADSSAVRSQAQSGLKDLSDDTKSYYQARKNGLRDKHTSENLGPQPQFFDSEVATQEKTTTRASSESEKHVSRSPSAQGIDHRSTQPGDTTIKPIDVNAPAHGLDATALKKIQDDPQVKAANKKLEAELANLPPDQANRMRDDMKKFKERAASMKPPLEPQEVSKTFTETTRLLESRDNPKLPLKEDDRRVLAEQVLRQSADPTCIDQGRYGTCTAAGIEERLYSRNPSAAAEMVRQVATTGEYTTHGTPPHKVIIDADSLARHPGPDKNGKPQAEEATNPAPDGKRSYASQVFQVTAVNVGHQVNGTDVKNHDDSTTHYPPDTVQYRQGDPDPKGNPPNTTGEQLVDMKTGKPITDDRGNPIRDLNLQDDRQIDIYNQITSRPGDRGVLIVNKDFVSGAGKDVTQVSSQADLDKALTEAKKDGKLPVTLKVNSGEEPFYTDSSGGQAGGSGGAHVVTVTDYDPATGKVRIDNTWGKNSDHDVDIKDLYKATQSPKDAIKRLDNEIAEDAKKGNLDHSKERELLRMKYEDRQLSDTDFKTLTVKSLEKECAENASKGKVDHIAELDLMRLKHESGKLSDFQYDNQLAWETKRIVQDAKDHNNGVIDAKTQDRLVHMIKEMYADEQHPKRQTEFENLVWKPSVDGIARGTVKDADTPDPKVDKTLSKDAEHLHDASNQWLYYNNEDYKNIYRSLDGKSPAQLAQMDREFQAKYGKSIDEYLNKKLENHPEELKQALARLHPELEPPQTQ